MDFTFSPEAADAAALAATIIGDCATTERMSEVEGAGDRFDADLWARLAEAGLLALDLPEDLGGAGLGLLEAAHVTVEVGRAVAPVPLATHQSAARVLAAHGSPAQQAEWLPGSADGSVLLTVALAEPLTAVPDAPTVRARRDDGGSWRVSGTKTLVRAGTRADAVLLTASTDDGPAVLLARRADLTPLEQRTSDGDTTARFELDGVPAELVGGAEAARALAELTLALSCAEQLGITRGAVRLTAEYARTREQFGRPIGTFQAVGQRLADAYIATLGQDLTTWQALWRLDEGLPASTEVAAAALWAADAGHTVAHTTVHVHGGVGIDLDGEAHRYFTAAKRWELTYGGATAHARTVGAALATQ